MTEKYYSESDIRKAVWETSRKYQRWFDKMDFKDIAIVENVLMNFEMNLFCGEVCKGVLE